MKITFLGHSALLVEADGVRVILDPFLSHNPAAKLRPSDVKVDAVILTHGHMDHFGDTLEIASANGCPVIAMHELAGFCESKGVQAHGMNLGGSHTFEGFHVKFVPALHSNSVMDGDQMLYAGVAAGVLLTIGGKTLYHVGDTALFSDLKLVGERHKIDAAAIPMGDNYTMGPEDALTAAEWIRPGVVIPVHYNTFPPIRQDGDAFAQACAEKGIGCKPLQVGESLEL